MPDSDDIAIAVSKVAPVSGDIVVLRLVGTTYASAEHVERIIDSLRAALPEGVRGVVVQGDMEVGAFGSLLDRAEAAVAEAHECELRAYLGGEIPANQWRPRIYAEAALRAAFNERNGTAAS